MGSNYQGGCLQLLLQMIIETIAKHSTVFHTYIRTYSTLDINYFYGKFSTSFALSSHAKDNNDRFKYMHIMYISM